MVTAVRDAIRDAGLSWNEAAHRASIAYATLHRKLNGIGSFNVAELRRLAEATGKQVADFLAFGEAA